MLSTEVLQKSKLMQATREKLKGKNYENSIFREK
jgi:hypothetical protein